MKNKHEISLTPTLSVFFVLFSKYLSSYSIHQYTLNGLNLWLKTDWIRFIFAHFHMNATRNNEAAVWHLISRCAVLTKPPPTKKNINQFKQFIELSKSIKLKSFFKCIEYIVIVVFLSFSLFYLLSLLVLLQ